MKIDIKPGDMFKWVSILDGHDVDEDDELWCFMTNRYIPIGGHEPKLCVGITDTMIIWLSSKGLFVGSAESCGHSGGRLREPDACWEWQTIQERINDNNSLVLIPQKTLNF